MSLTLIPPVSGFTSQALHRHVECWKVTTVHGEEVAPVLVTSHNRPIEFEAVAGEGAELYTPTNSFDSTASQLQSGLREQNRDILGVISDDRFTYDHLRAGVWDGADVIVSTVDWMYPFAGAFHTRRYKVGRLVHTGEQWTGELSGLTARLAAKSGRIAARPCDADIFDARCKLVNTTVASWNVEEVRLVASSQDANEPRRIFRAESSDLPSTSDDFYKYGKLTWTLGENADIGEVSMIKLYSDATRLIELYEPTPFAIDDADEFTIEVGCDKLWETCRDKFDPGATGQGNTLNYRGLHRIPGSDHVLRTPIHES